VPFRVRYHGHACVSLDLGGLRFVLDPFASPLFDGRFTYPLPQGPFDAAVCSHPHPDHAHVGPHLGAPRVVDADADVGPVRVRFVPTAHDPHGGLYLGDSRAVVLDAPEGRVVHCGDLGGLPDSATLARLTAPDLLFVPVGGCYTLDAAEAHRLVDVLRPGRVVPIHYRTAWCTLPLASPLAFLLGHRARYYPGGEAVLDPAEAGAPRIAWFGVYGVRSSRGRR
jgi:L-ascorbate metabolism protein UlaG (beta-lactamase superfamily)